MYEPARGRSGGRVALVAVLLLVAAGLGAGASYYVLGGPEAAAAANTVTSTTTSTMTTTLNLGSVGGGAPTVAIDGVQIYKSSNESVVTVNGFISSTVNSPFGSQTVTGEVLGSGFVMIYNNANYIVTNFHVVNGASNMTVIFWNGNAYPATVVGKDASSDLAIVKVPSAPSSEFHPLTLSSSSSVQVGAPVAAIGNPFGLSGSLTIGVVSQLGRTITEAEAGNFSI